MLKFRKRDFFSKQGSKERLEVFSGGNILQIDNFKSLKSFGWKGFKGM
jgi:hypothetical protein